MMVSENEDTDDHRFEKRVSPPFDDGERMAIQTLLEPSITSGFAAEQYDVDTIFDILSHPGRRYVLTYLIQSEGFVSISELVDYVITRTSASMTDSEFRRRVTVELTHTHLPKLEEEGLISYNMERQIVMQTDQTPTVRPFLALALVQQRMAKDAVEQEA